MRDQASEPKTTTRREIAAVVYKHSGGSRSEAADILDAVLETISKTLATGEAVKLHGFGLLNVISKKQRIGRNPATGKEAIIAARRVVSFRPSPLLTARINAE